MEGLPLQAMAALSGLTVRQLRILINKGAPLARAGRRGRGGDALICLHDFAEWQAYRALQGGNSFDVDGLADKVPHLIAEVITGLLQRARTRDEKRLLISAWYECANAIRDELAADELDPEVFTEISDALTSI
jgi:hypothetical protein